MISKDDINWFWSRYGWRTTEWTECRVDPLLSQQDKRRGNQTALCGGGIQTREVYCVQANENLLSYLNTLKEKEGKFDSLAFALVWNQSTSAFQSSLTVTVFYNQCLFTLQVSVLFLFRWKYLIAVAKILFSMLQILILS